jgi:nucleotide-binding universal stress UspA family protein
MIQDKIKRVLIALDYDPTALKVANKGFTMAKEMGAEVILLHIIMNLVTYSLTYLKMDPLKLKSVNDLKEESQDFLDLPKQYPGKDMIQTNVKQGDFAVSMLNGAKEMAVDLIIMGSHSSMWLEEIVMGRVTNEALQQNRIPILIIPTKKHGKPYTFISLEY